MAFGRRTSSGRGSASGAAIRQGRGKSATQKATHMARHAVKRGGNSAVSQRQQSMSRTRIRRSR